MRRIIVPVLMLGLDAVGAQTYSSNCTDNHCVSRLRSGDGTVTVCTSSWAGGNYHSTCREESGSGSGSSFPDGSVSCKEAQTAFENLKGAIEKTPFLLGCEAKAKMKSNEGGDAFQNDAREIIQIDISSYSVKLDGRRYRVGWGRYGIVVTGAASDKDARIIGNKVVGCIAEGAPVIQNGETSIIRLSADCPISAPTFPAR